MQRSYIKVVTVVQFVCSEIIKVNYLYTDRGSVHCSFSALAA